MTDSAPGATLSADGSSRRLALVLTAGSLASGRGALASLVRRAQRGDERAFEQLISPRLDRLYRLGLAILCSETDAGDAVGEAIVSSWRSLPSLRDPERLDPWIDRILVNACRMALRHRRLVRVRELSLSDQDGERGPLAGALSEPAPDDEVASLELIRDAFSRLDPDKRAVLVLHHVDDRPIDEIATVLGIPPGTVKWRLHQARAALERALEEGRR